MPMDCKISDECSSYQGDHCKSVRPFLIFYDVEELAAVYRGRMRHHHPQPYAKIPLAQHLIDGFGCGNGVVGSTYDQDRQLLYLAQSLETGGAVHMFSIGLQ